MWQCLSAFALGMVAPVVAKSGKSILRTVVKGGLIASDRVQRSIVQVREDFEDLVAEAAAELESKRA
jgi:Protein of unknown function (DUF5132)